MTEGAVTCNCHLYGNANGCPIHTQSDYDAQRPSRRRSRLVVEIDLDPVPGWGSTSCDHRNLLEQLLDQSVPHYNPTVEDVTDA